KIVLKDDHSLCMHAGYCGTRLTNAWKMMKESGDPDVKAKIIAMVEMCPSGTLTFALDDSSDKVEPGLPKEIGVLADGALWVSGGITVERRDGKPLEVRNRITLCRCGESANKPFCDGAHKDVGFTDS
ncbi:MAG: CDGSH iron-sulfur domain-containing protein, partial [Dehalococcoidia bacterium]